MINQEVLAPSWNYDAIAGGLRKNGWVHLPAGIDTALALDLLQDIHRHESEHWQRAGIGRKHDQRTNELVRRDATRWLTGETEPQRRYLAAAAKLQGELNRRLLLGLFDYECHYARYDVGAFYRKHRDAFRGRSNRVLSTVTYLNPEWSAGAGGELVLYDHSDRELARFHPTLGSMVLFLSEDFPHEVLAANRVRFSVAGWFRRNNSIQGLVDPSR